VGDLQGLLDAITGDGHISIGRLAFIFFLIALTHIFDTSAYASRLAGVRTKRLAISNTLYAMVTVGSRTTTFIYLPTVGGITDFAKKYAFNPYWPLSLVLWGAAVGTAIGIYLMPSMVNFYSLGIECMDERGTAMRVMRYLFTTKEGLRKVLRCWQPPTWSMMKRIDLHDTEVPRDLFYLNALLYALFTVGSIAALYAGVISTDHTTSANMLSGAVNSVAAILLLFMVDPRSALIVDRGIARKISLDTVRTTMVMLAVGRLAGTILAQFVLYPGAHFVAYLAKFF
jgi:hypothetical protein